jgi:hypothetical protein
MFRIRATTPPLTDDLGARYAAALLQVGPHTIHFRLDLGYWSIADYERHWQRALRQIMYGPRATALLSAYRGPAGHAHVLWALWQRDGYVHVQEQTLVVSELDEPFDPGTAHVHVGARVPASENALPIREWRIESTAVFAAALGIRWPLGF